MSGGICAGDLKMNIQRYEEAPEELGISIRLMESGIQLGKIFIGLLFACHAVSLFSLFERFCLLHGLYNSFIPPLQHLSDNINDLCIKSSITFKSYIFYQLYTLLRWHLCINQSNMARMHVILKKCIMFSRLLVSNNSVFEAQLLCF